MTTTGCGHFVQLHTPGESLLAQNVGRYLFDGVERGSGLVIAARPGAQREFFGELARLGVDAEVLKSNGRLLCFDARETLASTMLGNSVCAERFQPAMRHALIELSGRYPAAPPRVYGELVDVLWQDGNYAGALGLEKLWDELLAEIPFDLYCGYGLDIFGEEFQFAAIDALLCAHSILVPAADGTRLARAVERAMDEVFGSKLEGLLPLIKGNFRPSWPELPKPEATMLWLRTNLPEYAGDVLTRARSYYKAV